MMMMMFKSNYLLFLYQPEYIVYDNACINYMRHVLAFLPELKWLIILFELLVYFFSFTYSVL